MFGAVEISGARWCGKTRTALAHGASVSYVDDDLDLARTDPSLMTLGDRPRHQRRLGAAQVPPRHVLAVGAISATALRPSRGLEESLMLGKSGS